MGRRECEGSGSGFGWEFEFEGVVWCGYELVSEVMHF